MTPETLNKSCQVDPRPKSLVSKVVNATTTVEDKDSQTDDDRFVIVLKRTFMDRACSPINFPQDHSKKSNVESHNSNTSTSKNVIRKKHTVKRKKVQIESDTDTEIDVIE